MRLLQIKLLVLNRSTYRTSVCTSTALDALICVYNVSCIAFADATNRTLACTSTAADACVCNFVCHLKHLLYFVSNIYSLFSITQNLLIFKLFCNFFINFFIFIFCFGFFKDFNVRNRKFLQHFFVSFVMLNFNEAF